MSTPTFIDFDTVLSQNWDPNFHVTGKPMPANAYLFGLTVLDWDESFKKRLRKYGPWDLTIPFQSLESMPIWMKGNTYNDVGEIIGRYEPYAMYSNSTAQTFALSLIYMAEARNTTPNTTTHWTLENIEKYVKKIQGMVFPNTRESFAAPPRLLLNIGNNWKDVPIIIQNVTIESLEPFDTITGLARQKKIALECRVSYPSWQTIDGVEVWSAYDRGSGINGNEIFAYETLDQKYSNNFRGIFSR